MHQVRYFLAVANELNFTRAAEKCNVAQPSLTRAIKLLEEELGGPLFHRERANTHLSELGRAVRPNLEQILAQSQQVKTLAKDFKTLDRSVLKLGVMCTIPPGQLVELLSSVRTRHPGIELDIVDAGARELNAQLLEGELEVAIYCLPDESEADDRLHRAPLFKEQMVIALRHDHPLARKNAVEAKDLDGLPYLNRANCEYRGYAGDILRDLGVNCAVVHRSGRDDWILAMIASGLGYGFMPESCAQFPGVVARPLVEPEFWRAVNLVTVRGRPHSPVVSALVSEVARIDWSGSRPAARRGTPTFSLRGAASAHALRQRLATA
jgi:DNA-binding transcriptional LysR family regulator